MSRGQTRELDEFEKQVCATVLELRKSMGLTQFNFCKVLGVTLRTLQTWENAQVYPSQSGLRRLEMLAKMHEESEQDKQAARQQSRTMVYEPKPVALEKV